jgi:putative sigma-54 modulation protein
MMQLEITGKNIQITDALRQVTADKFKLLEKHASQISHIHVVYEVEHVTHAAEATLHFNGSDIHAHAKSDESLYNAIDDLVSKLLTQITRHKEKLIDSHRQA